MRKFEYLRKAIISAIFGALFLVGTAFSIYAQYDMKEYRDWQNAQARAEQQQQIYMRTNSPWDYRRWQDAQRIAQRQYSRYERSSSRYSNSYSNSYNRDYNNNNVYNRNYDSNRNDFNVNFRIYRNGSYYTTDSRGAELLRQAVRNGYAQGYRQGQIDKRYGRGYDYENTGMYRSGTYGYESYVERNEYQYFFQQGFQRGYEDGFNSTARYGF